MDTAVAPAHKLDSCAEARIARPQHSNGRLFRCTREWRSFFLFVTDSDSKSNFGSSHWIVSTE